MTLGQRIKYYRQLNRLSQESLGEKIRADARTISNYETEKYKPSADTIVLLARVFGVSTDSLLVESSYENAKKALEEEWIFLFVDVMALPDNEREAVRCIIKSVVGNHRLVVSQTAVSTAISAEE